MKKIGLSIKKREVIQRLALITGYSETVVRDVIKAETEFVLDEIKCGTSVRLGNIGELTIMEREMRNGYDFNAKQVRTGTKTVSIVKFHASASMKRAVKELNETYSS